MCRFAAYLGPEIPLQQFLLDPPHSLYRQSWEPHELKYAKLNADGFGFGWYSPEGIPSTYTSILPIWSDSNLPALARSLSNSLWIAEVRSATAGNPVHQFNTAPFHDDELLFVHNGFINEFDYQVRPGIAEMLSPEVAALIKGNTDSEYLFACLRQFLNAKSGPEIPAAVAALFELVSDLCGDAPALLNMVITEGARLYATRHGLNHECPSLYYTTDDEMFPGGQLIASERFSDDSFWQPVPEHHMLILDPDKPPELLEL